MANPFVHVELRTTDLATASEFYGKLFDWKLDETPIQTSASGPTAIAQGPNPYITIDVGKTGTGGGIARNPDEGERSWWLAYVLVDDVKEATKKAASLGATVEAQVTDVPGVGSFSIISDPTGARLALFTPHSG